MTIKDFRDTYSLTEEEEEILDGWSKDTDSVQDVLEDFENRGNDIISELADNDTLIYTSDQLDFYSKNLNNIYYMQDAIDEGIADTSDIFSILQSGCYLYEFDKFKEAMKNLKSRMEEYINND